MKKLILLSLIALFAVSAQAIEVVNFSFEEPGTGKQDLTNVLGWDAVSGSLGVEDVGSTGHYGPSVTDGSYNLYADDNAWASQLTSYTIAAGEVYQLIVDVSNTWVGTEGATIELYYDDAGSMVPMGSATYLFPNAANQEGPFELTLTVIADETPAAIGNDLGIKLGTTNAWVGFDNVRLEKALLYAPFPEDEEPMADKDDDLSWSIDPSVTSGLVYLRPAVQAEEPNFLDTANNIFDGAVVTAPTATIDPGTLEPDTTYFWRVDVYDSNAVPVLHEGPVWSFTTAPDIPVIITQPVTQTAVTGTPVTLSVGHLNGTSFQWYKENQPISGAEAETYEIVSVQKADEGVYYCEVANGAGTVPSETATLWTTRVYAHWDFEGDLIDSEDNWVGVYTDPNTANDPPTAVYDAASILGDQSLKLEDDDLHVIVADSNEPFNFHPYGYTVAAWVQTEKTDWSVLVSKENGTTSGWGIWLNGDTAVGVLRNPGDQNYYGTTSVADGQWHYIVSQYDPESSTFKLYVDGTLEAESISVSNIPVNDIAVSIGAVMTRSDGYFPFSGLIDDLTIWTYALSAEEIASQYGQVTGINTCVYPPVLDIANGTTGLVLGDEGFEGDCIVNLHDFAAIADSWLECGLIPNCNL